MHENKQLAGEASVTAIRQRLATEEVQVTYDLTSDGAPSVSPPVRRSSVTTEQETSLANAAAELEENRTTASPTQLIPTIRPSRQIHPIP